MNQWPSTRARSVLAALLRIGWTIKRQTGSHRTLSYPGWPDFVFAFHDDEELGPRMLAVLQSGRDSQQRTCRSLCR
jgi:predicted RNA binding protein YcfA (HicA-like mRNA interferase family)